MDLSIMKEVENVAFVEMKVFGIQQVNLIGRMSGWVVFLDTLECG